MMTCNGQGYVVCYCVCLMGWLHVTLILSQSHSSSEAANLTAPTHFYLLSPLPPSFHSSPSLPPCLHPNFTLPKFCFPIVLSSSLPPSLSIPPNTPSINSYLSLNFFCSCHPYPGLEHNHRRSFVHRLRSHQWKFHFPDPQWVPGCSGLWWWCPKGVSMLYNIHTVAHVSSHLTLIHVHTCGWMVLLHVSAKVHCTCTFEVGSL